MNKVLVGVTDAPEGRAALDRAIAEARLRQAGLVIVNHMRVGEPTERQVARFRAADERLERLQADLEKEGMEVRTRHAVGVSSPSHELLKAADEEQVDLIVIGIRRRSPVGKLVLGSTSQDVLLAANCPVLAVKATSDPQSD